jgi:hypothetical protein
MSELHLTWMIGNNDRLIGFMVDCVPVQTRNLTITITLTVTPTLT